MNLSEILDKIRYAYYEGKRYSRRISGKDVQRRFYQRKFKRPIEVFTENYLYSFKSSKNEITDVYDLPLHVIEKKLYLVICENEVRLFTEEEIDKIREVLKKVSPKAEEERLAIQHEDDVLDDDELDFEIGEE